MQSLKEVPRELNDKHFGHISSRAESTTKSLESVQLELHDDPPYIQLQVEIARLRKVAIGLCEVEMSFYYQQVNYAYLKNSVKCTKFFQSVVKRNTKKNYIAAILKRDKTYTSSQKEVADEFINFYIELLGKCSSG